MWYGESEKIIKGIFTRYRQTCKRAAMKPILLFNEADAIFSKRRDMDGGRSIDQTENTIQNIILEEMERLDGILIATTTWPETLTRLSSAGFCSRYVSTVRQSRQNVTFGSTSYRVLVYRMPTGSPQITTSAAAKSTTLSAKCQ